MLTPDVRAEIDLSFLDGCEACYTALEAGRQSMDNCSSSKLEDPTQKRKCLHMWPFIQATSKIPANTQDVSRMLKSLQPLLQDTLQKKRTTSFWESVYTVSGPLTWKDFHLLAGRGTLRTNLCIYDPRSLQFVH